MAIKWKVFVSGEGAPRATKTNIADSWMGGQTEWLTPSKDRSFVLSGIVTQDGKPVSRFEGVPVYVEFDDGTRLGADASSIFPELNRQRQALLNESRKALDIYSTSGKDALVAELVHAKALQQSDRDRGVAASLLLSKFQRDGVEAAIAELKRVTSLGIPK
jgi:hypothetical protein